MTPPAWAASPPHPTSTAEVTAPRIPTRTLLYTVGGKTQEPQKRTRPWKVLAGIGTALVAVGIAATVLLTSDNDEPKPRAKPQDPAPTSASAPPTAPDIGLSVTAVNDLGERVELKWTADGDLDFSVVVAGENIDTMVLVANRQRELVVPVDKERKYCFQIRATDSRTIYTSEPVPIRGARCGL